MEAIEKIKMFNNVFAPKKNEKILILIDIPHEDIIDSLVWKERRKMAKEWFNIFKKMSNKNCYSVDLLQYKATGLNNSPIPKEIYNTVKEFNLVIAMTEYSATSSLKKISLSGGEPSLRRDLADIVKVLNKKCNRPRFIISTNGLSPNLIEKRLEFLTKQFVNKYGDSIDDKVILENFMKDFF